MSIAPAKPVFAVGHRGASAYAPENTVAAFDEAIRLGAKAVEFDVRLTADGFPIILHDDTVDRTTNGNGPLLQFTRFDLLRLDAGSWMHCRFAGTRIPTLDEALLAIGPFARPVLELKVPIPADLLLHHLRKYDLEEEALVLSFEEAWLRPLRTASRDLALGLLADEWSPTLPDRAAALSPGCFVGSRGGTRPFESTTARGALGAEQQLKNGAAAGGDPEGQTGGASGGEMGGGGGVLCLNVDCLGTAQVAAAEARGLEVWCFTANDVGMVAACAAMGVSGIITDKPDLIRAR